MPSVVAQAAGFVVKVLTAGGIGGFLARAGATVLLSIATSKLFGPKVPPTRLGGHQVTARSALEHRRIVYGRAMVSGPITYQNLSGTNREYLWQQVALCQGRSSDLVSVWFDGDAIPKADIDWAAGTDSSDGTGTGDVSTSQWVGENSTAAVQLYYYLGYDDQPVCGVLDTAFTDIDSNNRLRGVTHLVAKLLYNEDTETVWEEGTPQNIKALIDGRLCYDRRRDALNADPDFETVGRTLGAGLRWYGDDEQTTVIDSAFTVASGVISLTNNDDLSNDLFSERIPVDTSKTYMVQVDARQTAGNRPHYLGVAFYDSAGDLINNTSSPLSDATGWAAIGVYHYFVSNSIFSASYNTEQRSFGPSGTASIPTGARTMSLVALLTRAVTSATETTVDLRDFTVYEYDTARHDFSDPDTWEWSDNPSVCIADYLSQVMGVAYASFDWESFIDAAQACDDTVPIPTASTEKRFTCNGALSLGTSHKDNLDSLISSCAGNLMYSAGKWQLRPSVWSTASLDLDADDLAGDIEIIGSSPKKNRVNVVRGFFIDPSRSYEAVEFPHVIDTDYITRDAGQEIPYDLELGMTNSETMAQRIAFRVLEQANQQITVNLKLKTVGARVKVGQTVTLTVSQLGWTSKLFRCIEWGRNQDGTFRVSLKEDASTAYTDPAEGDYDATNTDGISIPSKVVPPPSGLTATSVKLGIQLAWTNPAAHEFDFTNVYASSTNQWDDASLVATVRGDNWLHPLEAGQTRFYWIKALRSPALLSVGHPNNETSTISATAGGIGGAKLTGASLSDVSLSPTDSEVAYRLTSGGAEQSYEGTGGSFADIDDWLVYGSVGDYEAYMEDLGTGSTTPSGAAVDSWLALSSTRTWTLTRSSVGTATFNGRIRIRHATTGTEIVSAADNKLVSMSVEESSASVVIDPSDADVNLLKIGATAYAGVQFNSSGEEFRNANGGSTSFTSSRGNWLAAGAAADVWVQRVVNSGSLNWTDSGSTRLQLSTTRQFGISQSSTGVNTANVTFNFYDAASGGSLLDSVTIDLTATYEDFL